MCTAHLQHLGKVPLFNRQYKIRNPNRIIFAWCILLSIPQPQLFLDPQFAFPPSGCRFTFYIQLKSRKIAVGLIYFSHLYTPLTNKTLPIEWWQVLLQLTVYIIITFITKRTSCHSVGRYSTNVSDYRSILSRTVPHSSTSKINSRTSLKI